MDGRACSADRPDAAGQPGGGIGVDGVGAMPLEGRFFVAFLRGVAVREPVTLRQVWALITEPAPGQEVQCGELAIRGVAWSGAGPIARVEASVGDGSWQESHLVGERKRRSWQWWELITRVREPGVVALRARATDLAGRTQRRMRRVEPIEVRQQHDPRVSGSDSLNAP
ncbi:MULTISPECIES: hypothetical protein [Burkholderia]|uniref:hypothetical protein n=1 Tax=Burkholderia TaxID=32008 RepID=UPI0009E9A599|nr:MULTISPECIES: hypothetical protein [Burkholderia]